MDDAAFPLYLKTCKEYIEKTQYVEMYNYSDPDYDAIEQHPLKQIEFLNFLHRRGVFEPPSIPDGVKLVSGIRLIVQQDAQHPETFAPHALSLSALDYEAMVMCHAQVLWKSPQSYQDVISGMERAMRRFMENLPEEREQVDKEIKRTHQSLLSRLEFYTAKLRSMEHYIATSLARLDIQRSALNLDIATQQRELAELSKRDSTSMKQLAQAAKRDSASMKTLSLLGAIFLPSTYIASLFSTTFFDFLPDSPGEGEAAGSGVMLSPMLWLFFAITVPLTAFIIMGVLWWDRKKERLFEAMDADILAADDHK